MSQRLDELRILIVDSDPELRDLTRDMLDSLGIHQVYTIGDGSRTFEQLRDRNIDIVIVERQMTPLSGIELTRMIRTASDSPNPHVPILMVTAAPSMPDVIEARDIGVSEFLIRPFSIDNLKARLVATANNPRDFVEVESYFGPDRRRVDKDFKGEDLRGRREE